MLPIPHTDSTPARSAPRKQACRKTSPLSFRGKAGGALFIAGLLTAWASPNTNAAVSDFIDVTYDYNSDGAGSGDLPARLYVPPNADANTPIVIFFHGSGAPQGNNNTDQVSNPQINNLLAAAKDSSNPFYLLAPQLYDGGNAWNPTVIDDTMRVAAGLIREYNINPNKVYITGLSLGGGGTWTALCRYRDPIAAAFPTASTEGIFSTDTLVGKPIWVSHSRADNLVTAAYDRQHINDIRAAGGLSAWTFPSSGQGLYYNYENNLHYTEYDSSNHDSWSPFYGTTALYTWLTAQAIIPADTTLQVGETILFDFGNQRLSTTNVEFPDSQGRIWNATYGSLMRTIASVLPYLMTEDGRRTSVILDLDEAFHSYDSYTATTPYDNPIGRDGWYTRYGNVAELRLRGLHPGADYELKIYGSNDADRETRYQIGTEYHDLDVQNNASQYATFSSVSADGNGELLLTITGAPGSTEGQINAMELTRLGTGGGSGDTINPLVEITSPSTGATYFTNDVSIDLSGTASDASGVASVAWGNAATSASGAASGATAWSVTGVALDPGDNVITITATDSSTNSNTGADVITVTRNVAPVVNVGADFSASQLTNVALDATVTDDDATTVLWTQVSGPGTATFADEGAVDTSADFTDAGAYMLRLTATDSGSLTAYDEVTVTVSASNGGGSGALVAAINCGEFTTPYTSASEGAEFSVDDYYSGGSATGITTPIADTDDDTLYHRYRWGNHSYEIPVSTSGDYNVTLFFADNGSVGSRVFNVTLEGTTVLSNFDIRVEANANTALRKTFAVNITDGNASIAFQNVTGNAKINAILITEAGNLEDFGLTGAAFGTGSGSSRDLNGNDWEIYGGGAALNSTADAGFFEWTDQSGNFEVVARIDELTGGGSGNLAGLMIREGNAATDRMAFLGAGASGAFITAERTVTSATASTATTGSYTYPDAWVKLTRNGDDIAMATSTDGSTYTTADTVTLSGLASSVKVGLFVSNGGASTAARSVISEFLITIESMIDYANSLDIGAWDVAGSTTFDSLNQAYAITGSGQRLWSSSDGIHFAFTQWSGDCTVDVRLAGISNWEVQNRIGIMMRHSLTATDLHASAVNAGRDYQVAFLWRDSNAGTTQNTNSLGTISPSIPPVWLRLVRIGNVFTARYSLDGATWTTYASQTIGMTGTDFYVGLFVCRGKTDGLTTSATFDNLDIRAATSADLN
ncbi:malectin domain-containing carbohydrate-binding protein [Cerasicoccus frondis]|uniref:malectin domain-containing carbohydrate-binding protein n=1 Tax=Cerasicoccus frondis TaxID=490090 RepID=UPI002852B7C0|nr:malectin domain-containing carbohydrate-binding protein [Cerasicoccus frondis]